MSVDAGFFCCIYCIDPISVVDICKGANGNGALAS